MFNSNYGLSSVVSEIFNVEKCRDLETQVRGHLGNFVPKMHRFGDIRLASVQGHDPNLEPG